jgi:hypothetical protein
MRLKGVGRVLSDSAGGKKKGAREHGPPRELPLPDPFTSRHFLRESSLFASRERALPSLSSARV